MDKEKFLEEFNRGQHRLGRIMLILAAHTASCSSFYLGGPLRSVSGSERFYKRFYQGGNGLYSGGDCRISCICAHAGKWRKLSYLPYGKCDQSERSPVP